MALEIMYDAKSGNVKLFFSDIHASDRKQSEDMMLDVLKKNHIQFVKKDDAYYITKQNYTQFFVTNLGSVAWKVEDQTQYATFLFAPKMEEFFELLTTVFEVNTTMNHTRMNQEMCDASMYSLTHEYVICYSERNKNKAEQRVNLAEYKGKWEKIGNDWYASFFDKELAESARNALYKQGVIATAVKGKYITTKNPQDKFRIYFKEEEKNIFKSRFTATVEQLESQEGIYSVILSKVMADVMADPTPKDVRESSLKIMKNPNLSSRTKLLQIAEYVRYRNMHCYDYQEIAVIPKRIFSLKGFIQEIEADWNLHAGALRDKYKDYTWEPKIVEPVVVAEPEIAPRPSQGFVPDTLGAYMAMDNQSGKPTLVVEGTSAYMMVDNQSGRPTLISEVNSAYMMVDNQSGKAVKCDTSIARTGYGFFASTADTQEKIADIPLPGMNQSMD